METLVATLGIKERSVQGILQLFILDLKRYHILHRTFGSYNPGQIILRLFDVLPIFFFFFFTTSETNRDY